MNLTTDADPVVHWAKSTAGITYVFPIQRFVIAGMLDALAKKVDEDDDSKKGLIAVMPTGSGKTLCFQAAIALDGRPALVLYPLLALLEDQKRRFDELGIAAAVLRGGQSLQERNDLWAAVQCGKIKVVLSNPEAMLQAKTLEQAAKTGFAHLIVDESHCVCEWGKTFRPSYLQIPEIQRAANILLLSAFTATAGPEVLSTIQQYLFPECSPYVISGNPDRPNMTLRVMGCVNKEATIRQIFFDQHPNNMIDTEEVYMWRPGTALPRPAIVFCSSRKACEILCKILESDHPGKVLFYHAGLDREEKTRREKWFFDSSDGILVSTTAYGMGVDKQNIRSVIHRDLPQSIESFLQEAGRGGRDRKCSQAILLVGPGDIHLHANKYNDFSEARKNELISWIYEEGCLRAGLLQRMGIQETACFGCSVCHPDPPLEKNSYWSRMKHLCKELVGKRNQWVIQAAAQRICEEYFWDSCCIPTKRISQLPAMPEWDVFSTEKFLQDISKLSQAECSLFCRLLGISTVQVKDSS